MADDEEATRHRELLQDLMDRKQEELDAIMEMSAEAGFTPRQSLARTPPTGFSTPLETLATPCSAAEVTRVPQATKRGLTSPEEVQEALRRKVASRTQERSVAPPVGGIITGLGTGAPLPPKSPARPTVMPPLPPRRPSAAAIELFPDEPADPLATATVAQLVTVATTSTRGIMEAVRAKSSRLNKEEMASMGLFTERVASVVTHLTMRLAEAEKELASLRARPQLAAVQCAAPAPVPTYADRLRMGKRSTPKPAPGGPTLAIYPADKDGDCKTAEDTKALVKKSVNPLALGIQVSRVRRVGNAGVVVQTTSMEAAAKIRDALPTTVRVTEPQAKKPLVAIINVDAEITGTALLDAVYTQNLARSKSIGPDVFQKECRVAFKKTRQGSGRVTHVLECSPPIRDALIEAERVYVDWERYLVRDHIDIICCLKCHGYGHPAKYCRSAADVCGRCTEDGHRARDCPRQPEEIIRCATCKGAGKHYEGHRTMALECPARRYAETKAISLVNYG